MLGCLLVLLGVAFFLLEGSLDGDGFGPGDSDGLAVAERSVLHLAFEPGLLCRKDVRLLLQGFVDSFEAVPSVSVSMATHQSISFEASMLASLFSATMDAMAAVCSET